MARIGGVDLPRNKRLEVALTYIFGIGQARAREICKLTHLGDRIRTDELTEDQVVQLRSAIEKNYKIEGDLRRDVGLSIKRLMDLGCYRRCAAQKGSSGKGTEHSSKCANSQGS